MGFFAIILLLIVFVTWVVSADDFEKTGHFVCLTLLLIGSFLIFYDASSPITTEVKEVYTNNYEKYENIGVDSDKIGVLRKTETEATRFGAIFKDTTKYEFIGFKEL